MEREQVKKILVFVKDIDNTVALNKRIINDIEERYYSMNGETLGEAIDGMPKSKYSKSNPTETTALNIPESASIIMRELTSKNENLCNLKKAVLNELDKLPFSQKSIIYYFYIVGMKWVRISVQVHYSGTQCKKIRNRGLDNLAKHFEKNELIKNFSYHI